MRRRVTYPFSAIVGQQTLKSALLLIAIDPRIGGVLVRGERGTAKSTAVRSLAAVMPAIDVVDGCRYACDPSEPSAWCDECRERRDAGPLPRTHRAVRLIDLPVSATEDRLVGTLDLTHALKHGERVFEPGLLAEANRGVLYVDEVNLLGDHLVDTLLDAAAMGINTVEREGVSIAHPARFMLVGTMNPEEGELRPQLLDRFGLCVDVEGVREPESRVEIVRRRHAFDEDPADFMRSWADAEDGLATTIKHARLRLPTIVMPEELLYAIASLCVSAGVDGHRADTVMARAAAAHAALEGRGDVQLADVARVAPMVLAHRMRRDPLEGTRPDAAAVSRMVADALGSSEQGYDSALSAEPAAPADGLAAASAALAAAVGDTRQAATHSEAAFVAPLDRARRSIDGRRHESVVSDGRGRYVGSEPARGAVRGTDVALDATIRAAAPLQAGRETELAVAIEPADLKRKVRTRKVGATIVFCVDASGSMGASKRMDAARAAVVDLLTDAYQRRDRVGLVSFRGAGADVALTPTGSVELANLKLKSLPVGGATPLAAGMIAALDLLETERRRGDDIVPWLVLVTDGRANVGLDGGLGSEDARAVAARVRTSGVHAIVLDTSGSPGGAARELARVAEAEYVRIGEIDGGVLAATVRERLRPR